MSDADVMGAYTSMQAHVTAPQVQPVSVSTPTHDITIAPKVAPPAPAALPVINLPQQAAPSDSGGLTTGYAPGFAPQETVKTLRDSELYKNWAEKSGVMGRFRLAANSYTGAAGEITTQKDIALANAALQLQAPGGGGSGERGAPELRVASLEEAQPLLEQLYGIKAKVLKTHRFEEGTRNRLIELGNQAIASLEGPAKSVVQTAAGQLQQVGAKPENFLSSYELGLIQPGTAGTSGPAASPRGRLIVLPSGKQVFAQ
jgi:hypothetical protein